MTNFLSAQDVTLDITPDQLYESYCSGFRGVKADIEAYSKVRRESPRFHDLLPTAKGIGKGQVSLPYITALQQDPEFGGYESQTTGDCVSHSTRNSGYLDYCSDAAFGEIIYEGRFATEPIYGYRGHAGQGANCSRLALYVGPQGPGGFLIRKKYTVGSKELDLTHYNSRIGHNWGRNGTPDWVNELANDIKSAHVMTVKSMSEVLDALACGYGISMCSSLGFRNRRNDDGVAEQSGQWMHAMAWIGCDDSDWAHQNYGGPLILVQNSWGEWIQGGTRYHQPIGSMWIRASVANRMIRGGGGLIVGHIKPVRERIMDRRSALQVEYANAA